MVIYKSPIIFIVFQDASLAFHATPSQTSRLRYMADPDFILIEWGCFVMGKWIENSDINPYSLIIMSIDGA